MRLGLDGWATNALQSAAEQSSRTARIVVWWPAGFGSVVVATCCKTNWGVVRVRRALRVAVRCKLGAAPS